MTDRSLAQSGMVGFTSGSLGLSCERDGTDPTATPATQHRYRISLNHGLQNAIDPTNGT
jgi:hypothetical protein